jgi:hypothetical protein
MVVRVEVSGRNLSSSPQLQARGEGCAVTGRIEKCEPLSCQAGLEGGFFQS